MVFNWEMGRQLSGITNGSNNISYNNISYKYNENGIRTSKTVNGVTTKYTLVDDRITYQTDGTTSMYYRYDSSNSLIGFEYTKGGVTTDYYYVKNLQGDIIGILDKDGNSVVEYSYDAWGKLQSVTGSLASTVGQDNAFRYRGYYYDVETGFFYVGSRYYDPNTCRFLNADEPAMLGLSATSPIGANLFAYCNNNPVMYYDPDGLNPIVIAGIAITAGELMAIAAMLVFSFSYIFNIGGFRTKINKAVGWAINSFITSATSIYNAYPKIGRWAAGVIASLVSGYAAKTAGNALPGIASKYGNFKCKEAANAMKKELIKRNQHGAVITITFVGGRGYIWSESKQKVISENGIHVGILYKGRVYDNVHPFGLTKQKWINDFSGTGIRNITEIPF